MILKMGKLVTCALQDLQKGDKVQIKHAHEWDRYYWKTFSEVDYKYLGFWNGGFQFQNIEHPEEHFRMSERIEFGDEFIGKYI